MTATTAIPKEWLDSPIDVKEVVPKAIDYKEKVDVLKFLCYAVVSHLPLANLEEVLLSNVFPGITKFVDKVFLDILEGVQLANDDGVEVAHEHKVEILHGYLLVLLAILECIENCMKYIHEAFSCINICQVHSLPVPVLLIVKSTFNHCKESENIYGSVFHDVSQELSLIFRKAFELQKVLMELINAKIETLTMDSSEEDLKNIAEVCHSLLDVCDIAEGIDGNITPGLWKSLMRLVIKNKEKIKNHIEVEKIVSQMCCTLELKLQSYQNLVKDNKQTQHGQLHKPLSLKLSKVLKFLMKLLMAFVQSFQDLIVLSSSKCILRLIFLIISLMSDTLMSQPMPLDVGKEFRESLIIAVEPFLQIMVSNKNFADSLTLVEQEVDPKNNFSRCYTLANVVVLLPTLSEEMLTYWIDPDNYPENEPRISVLEALFQSSASCFVEMSLPIVLPGAICNGKPQRNISFHEYVVSRLTATITAIPSRCFHVVERILLKNVLGRSLICSLMATDVWCFMARWATADLCYCHVKLFVHWLATVSWKDDLPKTRLCTLVRRLLPLLAIEHQDLVVKEYSPDSLDNVAVWSLVPLHKMIEPVRQEVSQSIVPLLNSMLRQWLNKNLSNVELDKVLHCLQNLVSQPATNACLLIEHKTDLVRLIMQLFDVFMDIPHEISHSSWSSFTEILKSILPVIQSHDFIKFLHKTTKTVMLFKDDLNNMYLARVMGECGKRASSNEQNESTCISEIFCTLVTSKSWLVHHEAFLALRRFAEVTLYTPVLEECVPDELKGDFQKFICAIPYGCLEDDNQSAKLLVTLREQATKMPSSKDQESSALIVSVQSVLKTAHKEAEKRKCSDEDQNDSKRKRIESQSPLTSEDEQKLTSSVEELSRHILIIQGISSRCDLPMEIYEKLKTVKESLDTLVKST